MFEVIRWISLAILWACIGLNVWTLVRTIRLNKRLEVERKYCTIMMKACTDFLEARGVKVDLAEEDSDEGNDHD